MIETDFYFIDPNLCDVTFYKREKIAVCTRVFSNGSTGMEPKKYDKDTTKHRKNLRTYIPVQTRVQTDSCLFRIFVCISTKHRRA